MIPPESSQKKVRITLIVEDLSPDSRRVIYRQRTLDADILSFIPPERPPLNQLWGYIRRLGEKAIGAYFKTASADIEDPATITARFHLNLADRRIKDLEKDNVRGELELKSMNPCPSCGTIHETEVFPGSVISKYEAEIKSWVYTRDQFVEERQEFRNEIGRLEDYNKDLVDTLNQIGKIFGYSGSSSEELLEKIRHAQESLRPEDGRPT